MKFEVYKDKRKEWRWRLRASNGKILAVSSEGYSKRTHALEMMRVIQENSPKAKVVFKK